MPASAVAVATVSVGQDYAALGIRFLFTKRNFAADGRCHLKLLETLTFRIRIVHLENNGKSGPQSTACGGESRE